jgi:hypothetical protein
MAIDSASWEAALGGEKKEHSSLSPCDRSSPAETIRRRPERASLESPGGASFGRSDRYVRSSASGSTVADILAHPSAFLGQLGSSRGARPNRLEGRAALHRCHRSWPAEFYASGSAPDWNVPAVVNGTVAPVSAWVLGRDRGPVVDDGHASAASFQKGGGMESAGPKEVEERGGKRSNALRPFVTSPRWFLPSRSW